MMATTPSLKRSGNGLALLANKCAARTFDISSGMVYASIRDQIVRAQLLIRDLKINDPQCNRILIIGGGVAGVAAATCASEMGIQAVLLETKDKPFHLQSTVTNRMVGPFMYEWPSLVSASQNYPSSDFGLSEALDSTPSWQADIPITASDLAQNLSTWLKGRKFQTPEPRFFFGVDAKSTKKYVKSFVACVSKSHRTGSNVMLPTLNLPTKFVALDGKTQEIKAGTYVPDYTILAVGMGAERVFLVDNQPKGVQGVPFWANDDLRDPKVAHWEIGVFGGGDGALQDVLRLITNHAHPLSFIKALEEGDDHIKAELDNIRPRLEALEQQSRLLASWTSGPVYDLIDVRCKEVCEELSNNPNVVNKVLTQIRTGTGKVFHVYKEAQLGRAYLLNRFCVHLIFSCLQKRKSYGLVTYEKLDTTRVVSASKTRKKFMVSLSNGHTLTLRRVVVRYGSNKDDLEKRQLVKLSEETKADRISMASIPLPYVVAK